eukprot:COSAG05_NODE_66_length_22253_cov_14.954455_15_plen_426_part_01
MQQPMNQFIEQDTVVCRSVSHTVTAQSQYAAIRPQARLAAKPEEPQLPTPGPEPAPELGLEPEPELGPQPPFREGVAVEVVRTLNTVRCCICGTDIDANPVSMCHACISTDRRNNLIQLPEKCEIINCDRCNRYLLPPKKWVEASWESRELLQVCLKRIKGLNRLKLVDASFVWTEPHSKRVKMKLTVSSEVYTGTVLEQQCLVEYVIVNQQCRLCQRAESSMTWTAVVQLRQKVAHRRTFLYLEQLILKNNAQRDVLNIKTVSDGMDFYFAQKQDAAKFAKFVQSSVPVQMKASSRVVGISHHVGTSTAATSILIAPICKHDLLWLPKPLSRSLGGLGPLVLCTRVASTMRLLCPSTLATAELTAASYFKSPFLPLCSDARLVEYEVLDVEVSTTHCGSAVHKAETKSKGKGKNNSKSTAAPALD